MKLTRRSKRFITILLTAAMVIGSCFTVFASEQTTTASGSYYEPTILVTVPGTATFYLNPAKVEISANDPDTGANVTLSGQIASPAYVISSSTNCALKAKVGIKNKASGVTLVASAPASGTSKWACVSFRMDSDKAKITSGSTASVNKVLSDNEDTASYTLAKSDGSTPTKAYFGFNGTVAAEPDPAWKATDAITTTLKFTFLPTATN